MRPGPIRPGDSDQSREVAVFNPGFNEARADSPGRYLRAGIVSGMSPQASMRPGPIRPGDVSSSWDTMSTAILLQ